MGDNDLVRVGHLLAVSPQHLILRAGGPLAANLRDLPRLGSKVVDSGLKAVGTIHDIFGPTEMPFVSVKTPRTGKTLESFQTRRGEPMYVEKRRTANKRRKRSKRFTPRGNKQRKKTK
ncbi:MAG: H/ACA ribonucleoprotein complex subunit GAR1 [Promethearchaeota archaeon]